MSITNELLKNLYAKKAALQDDYWFNQDMDMKEYIVRYNELNEIIRKLELKKNNMKKNCLFV